MAADESIYGFGSTDVQRIGSVVSFVERDPRYTLRKRKYPIGGGGGGAALVPYIITETVEDDMNNSLNVAVYRDSVADNFTLGKKAIRTAETTWGADPDAEEETLSTTTMNGVSCTGQIVLVANIDGGNQIVGGWCGHNFHEGDTVDAIAAADTGTIAIEYLDNMGDTQTAEVEAYNTLDRGLEAEQRLLMTTFSDATQTFYIIAAGCP